MNQSLLLRGTILTIILLTSVSCGTKKIDSNLLYEQVKEKQNMAFQTYYDAVNKSSSTTLTIGKEVKDKVSINDNVINHDGYLSNFKVYKFTALAGINYKIIVKSYCDCLGFAKQIMVPNVILFNSDTMKFAKQIEPQNPTFSEPLNLLVTDEIKSPQDQTIYIIISSQNTGIGQDAIDYIDIKTGKKFRPMMQPTKHPVGEISIKISEVTE